jgi:ubiquitin-protein ligase
MSISGVLAEAPQTPPAVVGTAANVDHGERDRFFKNSCTRFLSTTFNLISSSHIIHTLSMAASKQRAEKFLMQELKALSTGDRDDGFSAGLNGDDLFNWSVCIMGPEGSLYEGGIFQASLQFPHSYPDNPPVMRFITPIFHPNIWPDGKVCISILHPPGEDPLNPQEQASERWLPIHNVFSICMSVSTNDPLNISSLEIETLLSGFVHAN